MSKLKLLEILFVIAIVGVVVAMLVPNVEIFKDGEFELVIKLPDEISAQPKPAVAICWTEAEAEHAMETGVTGYGRFSSLDLDAENTGILLVSYSGKQVGRKKMTHNEPKYIVLQIEQVGNQSRYCFPIPEGRGDRKIAIELEELQTAAQ